MGLPDIITVHRGPASDRPIRVTVPGSKSITNRALILAAFRERPTTLKGALWSEDTQAMTRCLRGVGVQIEVEPDPNESANRALRVTPAESGGFMGGSEAAPVELFVDNAGTAARFLIASLCLGHGVFRIDGIDRMRERPQEGLIVALRELGYRIDSPNNRLPAVIHGAGRKPGRCRVSVRESSQFASALVLAAERGGWDVEIAEKNDALAPYLEMTREMIADFARAGEDYQIEPDASSGSYFWAAGNLLNQPVEVADWPKTDWQIDRRYPKFWPLPDRVSRETDLGDSIMTAIVTAPFADRPIQFTDLGRLRVQECERVVALRDEMIKLGIRVEEAEDSLKIHPLSQPLRPSTIATYNDHRVAMCFSILALRGEGIQIEDPSCVKKTFPNFFAKLAAAPPHGLGVALSDGVEELTGARLIAE